MEHREQLEQRAAQCRRLAEDVGDKLTFDRLVALAKEYEAKADGLEQPETPQAE